MRAAAVMLVSLAAWSGVAACADAPSFAAHVLPLFKSRCLVCHMPGAESGELSLHPKVAYANLVGARATQGPWLRVAPGKPDESYLYLKVTGRHLGAGGSGERMPFNEAPLTTEQVNLLRRWIETGANP
jgi:mono/diheme cytochrome c family protein